MTNIIVTTIIPAPMQKIWQAYTSADAMTKWNFASADWHCPRAQVDFRVGGQFSARMEAKDGSAGFDFVGQYTKIIDEQLIEYQFGDRHAKIVFEQTTDGVKLTVDFIAEFIHSMEQQQLGWQAILNNFKNYVMGAM